MSNLDYKVRLELRHELRALQRRIGITAVYVTHDREEALTLADRIAVIDAGRIVQSGTPEDIFHRPASRVRRGLHGRRQRASTVTQPRTRLARGHRGRRRRRAPVRAHFRSDAARLLGRDTRAGGATPWCSTGRSRRSLYVGQGYRYRVRLAGADIWVHAPERVDEGTAARVVVPRRRCSCFLPIRDDHAP